MADFAPAIAFTLGQEGGFSDDPQDPGGATNLGITLATLSNWRGHSCTVQDVRTLTQTEAKAIYTANYWNVVGGPNLPPGLDLTVFDFGVNAGPGTSAKMLQRILGVVRDGAVGPITLAAAQCSGAVLRARIGDLAAAHEAYYHSLPGFAHDGKGWTARVLACQAASIRLAAGLSPLAKPVATVSPQQTTDQLNQAQIDAFTQEA